MEDSGRKSIGTMSALDRIFRALPGAAPLELAYFWCTGGRQIAAYRPHALKYRLFFGRAGRCLVRYDNESGKGDHRHIRGKEMPYRFVSLARLRRDFESDMRKHGGEDDEEDPDIGR